MKPSENACLDITKSIDLPPCLQARQGVFDSPVKFCLICLFSLTLDVLFSFSFFTEPRGITCAKSARLFTFVLHCIGFQTLSLSDP